jgi:hypothetical protein
MTSRQAAKPLRSLYIVWLAVDGGLLLDGKDRWDWSRPGSRRKSLFCTTSNAVKPITQTNSNVHVLCRENFMVLVCGFWDHYLEVFETRS